MITFRYHIVSLVSVFLALAIGIALGGGPLKGEVDNTLVEGAGRPEEDQTEQRHEIRRARGPPRRSPTASPRRPRRPSSRDTLRGVPVTVVSCPAPTVRRLRRPGPGQRRRRQAGRRATAVGDQLVDAANKGLVDELGTQLEPEASDVEMPADASTYERIGLLLARAIGTRSKAPQRYDTDEPASWSGLQHGRPGVRRGHANGPRPGGAGGDRPGRRSPARRPAIDEIHAVVADALTDEVSSVVLAGPADAARDGGLVRRSATTSGSRRALSTVDAPAPAPARWSRCWPPRRTSRPAPASTAPSTRPTAPCPAARPGDG